MSGAIESSVTFGSGRRAMPERALVAEAAVERAQLHSELVLVCPELRSRLRELLPERASDGLVARSAGLLPAPTRSDRGSRHNFGLTAAVLAYAGHRLLETAFWLIAISALFVLLWLAEVFVRT